LLLKLLCKKTTELTFEDSCRMLQGEERLEKISEALRVGLVAAAV